ncbi:MAG: glycoside hydrolase family 2 TIM barrel-domain containing protein [Candidatus Sulfotelmatobacter sp.]|jgi:beta-glucuronidase
MKSCLAFFLFSTLALAAPAPSNLIADIPSRTRVNLDGNWNAIVDPFESGLNSRVYENRKAKDRSDLIEYDFDTSATLKVPGDWNTQREKLLFYEGPIWYQRYFSYHKRDRVKTFLNFGAANYLARVYLNGEKIGEHEGGFTPFIFEVTGKILEGQNSLVVEVNNARHVDAVPALSSDWWNYGGLTRSVDLVEVPETFIQDYVLQLAKGSSNEITGWVQLNGASQPQPVSIEIPELNFQKKLTTDAAGRAEFDFPAKLELWSPEHPKLYRVLISSGAETLEDQIGFRSVETRGTQILLNGQPIFLRGINLHEEAPFDGGRIISEDQDRILLAWAKEELGCNFVRLAHYPYNESMIRLADRMGILVWEEVPVYWDIAWQNPATLENAEAQLRDVITRDHDRAAVILWSLSNETPPKPERTEFLKAMAEYARTLDSTRLLTSAMNRTQAADFSTRRLDDALGQSLDVLGLNEYVGWYDHRPEDADAIHWKFAYQKPVIVSEFGAGALYGKHGDAQTRFSEEYQANVYEHQIKMLRQIPALAGMTPWLLMDFRSPRRLLAGVQDFYNRKGLISDRGQRKQAFYVLQKFYEEMKKRDQP